MPLEVERKLVFLEPFVPLPELKEQDIVQMYSADGARVRHSNYADGRQEILFCWKSRIPAEGLLEIETPISERDAEMFGRIAVRHVSKTRYAYPSDDGRDWMVDVFLSGLVMAEVEGKTMWNYGDSVPDLLKGRRVSVIAEDDKNFSSHALSDEEGMRRVMLRLKSLPSVVL